eukprot:TRINITY_DN31964_c0_g1_i1.p1 TRINITY_DN31964_c0_g1~~TRINITY_DN31964_c0_g1_i1.p1  ORF type:complete len:207 (+),score=33.90 TRINITY_DN31964_c0_g1_i1:44-664(+)
MSDDSSVQNEQCSDAAEPRFSLNDRVVCRTGDEWNSGTVFDTSVERNGKVWPYGVKLESGAIILIQKDDDSHILREVCFDDWRIASDAAPEFLPQDVGKPTRFKAGEKVGFRVHDTPDGLDKWLKGSVQATWFELEDGYRIPYQLRSDADEVFFGHRDDHTLVRLQENIPQTRIRTMAPKMEKRKREDGRMETIDHATGNSRIQPA